MFLVTEAARGPLPYFCGVIPLMNEWRSWPLARWSEVAEAAKNGCPVSKAYAGSMKITLDVKVI